MLYFCRCIQQRRITMRKTCCRDVLDGLRLLSLTLMLGGEQAYAEWSLRIYVQIRNQYIAHPYRPGWCILSRTNNP